MTRYVQITSKTVRHFSEWRPITQKYLQACCGCGLVHEWRFSHKKVNGRWLLGKRLRTHKSETIKERLRLAKKSV